MKQRILIVACLVVVMALLWNFSPMPLFVAIPYDVFRSAHQKRKLQSRQDYPEIAARCVMLARSVTDNGISIDVTDQRVPETLRSLGPRSIFASSNQVTLEFHGAFDHYGYRVRQSDKNPKEWSIFWYTEQGERLLTTISHD